jgi:hypothetical protein
MGDQSTQPRGDGDQVAATPGLRGALMSKQSKKRAKQFRGFLSGLLMFIPALLAAATAFVNAAQINAKGGVRLADLGIDGWPGSGDDKSSGSRKSSSKSRKRSR